jgi:hypothetical protein
VETQGYAPREDSSNTIMAAQKRLINLNVVEICEDKRPIAKIKVIIPNKTISSLYLRL